MKFRWTMIALLPLLAAACQSVENDDDEGEEQEIALDAVPSAVRAAAVAAVPGFVLEEACTETEDGVLIYCLEGKAKGTEYEVDVAADGRVLEVDAEEEEEEAGEGDDDDDDGEDDEDEDDEEDDD